MTVVGKVLRRELRNRGQTWDIVAKDTEAPGDGSI